MKTFEWMIIGAGPAGIAAVGQLLELDVAPETIAWIDPSFRCGDFGQVWRKVESNTPVESFHYFYKAYKAFRWGQQPDKFFIEHMQDDKHCPLLVAAEPLHWITTQLRQQILSVVGVVQSLQQINNQWHANVSTGQPLTSKKVIIATGAYPRTLDFDHLKTIPLATALDHEDLAEALSPEDRIAVFGGGQSARSVLENLHALQPKKIVHFYRDYASYEYHLSNLAFPNIDTFQFNNNDLIQQIPDCNKAVYAIGFEKRCVSIHGLPKRYDYDRHNGTIAPNVFGLGIAFPEILPHRNGQADYPNIAIAAFVERVQSLCDHWLDSDLHCSAT